LALHRAGQTVVGFDISEPLVARLRRGASQIVDVANDEVQAALDSGLRVTSCLDDISECTTYIVCVPTPLAPTGIPDTTAIEAAARSIALGLGPSNLVILESTSYPGTTEEVLGKALLEVTGLAPGKDFHLAFSPERVDPGNPSFDHSNTPKIVAGLTAQCQDRALEVYASLGGGVVAAQGLREAELAKLLENTYRQVNIALMNEMVKFCQALEIDIYEAIRLATTKPFGFAPFHPGPGVGGHCIPIDPKYLAARVESTLGKSFQFIELAQEINEGMPAYVVDRLEQELAKRNIGLLGARILLLGVTYKKNVADTRETPSLAVAREVGRRGARVHYFDPLVDDWKPEMDSRPIEWQPGNPTDFAATVLLQDHDAIMEIGVQELAPLCLDTRGVLSGPGIARL
jgi:nucleotide sugar dehydrogenase